MARPLALLAAAVAAAAVPGGAAAKEVEKTKVCGSEGCTLQTSEKDRQTAVAALEHGGPPSSQPSRHAPFYRVTVYVKPPDSAEAPFRFVVVPAARRVRGPDGTWFAMDRLSYRAWRGVTRGIRPFRTGRFPPVEPPSPPRAAGGGQLPPQTYAPALAAPAGSDDGGTAWGLIGGIAAGTLALAAGAAALLARRRRRKPPAPPRAAPVS